MLIVAAVALIDKTGCVLLSQRPEGKAHAGQWEFPGGKVEEGENVGEALIRELREELGIDTETSCLAPLAFNGEGDLLLLLYACRKYKGVPTPLEGQTLAWARPDEIFSYDLVPADKPLAAAVRDLLS
ncbi:(deoxy)nucleoside triphosphate pyrophosphohydrolase [Parvularcula lutaonensis]|uniref:8-oxo-dGTP diphosphatase n=1 Tax=Parvularcula lutaonensis TaxID=491923 RepID=A0ABV7MB51_9PROT|nr:(deoxy)nucleoside triphosphate pyrophosphohydrolase [Parvularcula lutaonensis]GGY39630.1 NTP pyrophosphohydrolase [Parvularcula lutaonensis]